MTGEAEDKDMWMRRALMTLVAALPLLLLTACDLDTVAEVKADPFEFTSKDARLGEIVTQSIGALGYGLYELEDKTGKIWVISRGHGVPGKGAKIEVKGKVQNGFTFAGTDYGTVIMESDRKLHKD